MAVHSSPASAPRAGPRLRDSGPADLGDPDGRPREDPAAATMVMPERVPCSGRGREIVPPAPDRAAVVGPPPVLDRHAGGELHRQRAALQTQAGEIAGRRDIQAIQAGWSGPSGATQAVAGEPSKADEARYSGRPCSRPEEGKVAPGGGGAAIGSSCGSGAVGRHRGQTRTSSTAGRRRVDRAGDSGLGVLGSAHQRGLGLEPGAVGMSRAAPGSAEWLIGGGPLQHVGERRMARSAPRRACSASTGGRSSSPTWMPGIRTSARPPAPPASGPRLCAWAIGIRSALTSCRLSRGGSIRDARRSCGRPPAPG